MTDTWKCDVCGYVHSGAEPPRSCPVCGADRDCFGPLVIVAARPPDLHASVWRCTICDHLNPGSEPPENCPVCGAPAHLFEPSGTATPATFASDVKRLVIVGAGVAGVTAAEEARKAAPDVAIVLVSRERSLPYYRLNLTRYLAGEVSADELIMQPEGWYRERRIDWQAGEVMSIDREARRVGLRDGTWLLYDRLILAGGSHPFVPPIAGVTRDGVGVLRTLDDACAIEGRLAPGRRCVCLGGGLLGLETAGALQKRGGQVTVLEGQPWLLPRQLPRQGGELLQELIEGRGIGVRCGVEIRELSGDEQVRGVRLEDGSELPAELVVVSAGVRPNSYLARQAGLKVDTGILVDDRMTTSDPAILAAGDIAEHRGLLYGIWPASYAQGMIAGLNAVGGTADFSGLPPTTRLKVLDVDLFSIGALALPDASYRLVEERDGGTYRGLVIRDGRIVGAALLGDSSLAAPLTEAVREATPLAELPELVAAFPRLGAG